MTSSFVFFQVNAVFGFEEFNFFFLEIFVHLAISLWEASAREREHETAFVLELCQVTMVSHDLMGTNTRDKVLNDITFGVTKNSYSNCHMGLRHAQLDVRNSSGSQHVPMVRHVV